MLFTSQSDELANICSLVNVRFTVPLITSLSATAPANPNANPDPNPTVTTTLMLSEVVTV